MKPLRSDAQEIARALALLFQPGDVVELRVPKTKRDGVVYGYFSDHGALAKCLAARNGEVGVYVTINPVVPALLARCANRVETHAQSGATTSDKEIACRRWMLIDCDPVRPSGISSTDAEHEAALERARDIRLVLSEEGWPAPILADSGNGAHLLYKVDLPNDDASRDLLKGVLQALARRFDDAAVKIDQVVFNAARITKAYGTVASKGDSLPEYPHRPARILESPAAIEAVERARLEEMAITVTSDKSSLAKKTAPEPAGQTQRFDLAGFLSKYLQALDPVPHEGGRKWVLETCPFDESHRAPDSAVFESAAGVLGFRYFYDSCANYGWRELRARFEEPRSKRQEQPPRPPPAPPLIMTCAQVLALETTTTRMMVEDYPLPASGATLKVGAAKSGKTVLCVQEAIAIATGRPLLDYYRVLETGPVMIVEHDDPSGAESISEILKKAGVPADTPLYVVPRLDFGFAEAMLEWLEQQITEKSLRLVVLDSYTALRGARPPGLDIVKVEQGELSRLDALAKRLGCAVDLIHHGSKGAAGLDWTMSAAGSFAMAAATECQFHLSRFSELGMGAPERLLRIRGRHAADLQAVLRFSEEKLAFEFVMAGAAADLYPTLSQIKLEFGGAEFGPKDLVQKLGVSRATAHRTIARLLYSGALDKLKFGNYKITAGLEI